MTTIKIGEQTLEIEDGLDVEIGPDRIRVKARVAPPVQIFVYPPQILPLQPPYQVFPMPYFPGQNWPPTLTCGASSNGADTAFTVSLLVNGSEEKANGFTRLKSS